MGLMSRLGMGLIRLEQKASAAGSVISGYMVGRPVWTDRDFAALADEAYVRNAVAFRCTKLISSSAAPVPWMLTGGTGKSRKEIDEHPLLDLLSRPGPMIGGHSLFEAWYAYLLLAGNTYFEAVGPNGKPPKEIWNLRPDRTHVIAGSNGLPAAYEYEAMGQRVRWDVDPVRGTSPVLHVKDFHPLNDWYGMSRVEPAAYGVDRHNAASAHNKALLDNGARPSGALVFKPITSAAGQPPQSAPKEIIEEAEERLKDRHGGAMNAGRPLVFGGNVEWQEMGISPKDMDFGAGKDDAARDICSAFGVPHILVVPGQSTYNNVREAKLELWEDTILPMIDKTVDALNAWLCPQFGDDLRLSVDYDEIPALEPRRESKRTSIVTLLDKGVIDHDEAREALQYGPRPGGAVKAVDGPVITALVAAVQTTGIEPLARYLVSVGLLPPGATAEDVINAALDLLPSDQVQLDALPAPTKGAADMRTLYVSRPLLNSGEFIAWAKEQGFDSTLAPADLHVTVAFSSAEVDWSKLEPENETLTVTATVDRSVSPLGDKGAVVLHFASSALTARWQQFKDAGASWDWPSYRPHVSITYAGKNVDLSKVEPFMGQLIFGPERFAEVNADWQAGVVEQ